MEQWDALPDDERDWWIARWEAKRDECPQCHRPRSECSDPEKVWFHNRAVCYASMTMARVEALYDDLYGGKFHDGTFKNWSTQRSAFFPYAHRDGVSLWLSPVDLTPGEDFLKPSGVPAAHEGAEDEDEAGQD